MPAHKPKLLGGALERRPGFKPNQIFQSRRPNSAQAFNADKCTEAGRTALNWAYLRTVPVR